MKIKYQSILFLVMTIVIAGIYTSCQEDDELTNGGKPVIHYIRITDPAASDSLITEGFQDNIIAIVGDNLQGLEAIFFNDRRGALTPTAITKTTVLTLIPAEIPEVINNKMTLYFSNGETLEHDFVVRISAPEITNMKSEFVNAGGVATIRGNFFYEPLTVTFTGGATGEIVSLDETILEVEIPEGAEPGPITISTNFGEAESPFWFRDNRNVFISADPAYSGWWGGDLVVNASDPLSISGNFIRITKAINAWAWTEMLGGPPDALGPISQNIPDDAVMDPEKYYLKFEVNTIKPYVGNRVKIMLGRVTNPDPNWDNEPYYWEPPLDTKGEWQTIAIPFEDVVANYATWSVLPSGYGVKIWFHGPGALDADMAFDNFRVVPKD